jgi:aspartyl-tRNA synthetase
MLKLKRSHYCGDIRKSHTGQAVVLNGWVDVRRDHGGLVFADLRDRTGLVQIVLNPQLNPEAHKLAGDLHAGYVLAVRGEVAPRPEGTVNTKIPTGEIEIKAVEMEILNPSLPLPFDVASDDDPSLEIRLKHRYLDLRRAKMQRNLIARSRITRAFRDYFDRNGFLEIETPFMVRYTPGGARNFVVPSRLLPGSFYALAESPQLFKQLFMVAGMDRYVQVVRCFRDEDLRADRQPEFTQVDLEMSFIDEIDIMTMVEGAMAEVFQKALDVTVALPLQRMTYHEAMTRFGSDKPDLRFGIEIGDLSDLAAKCEFNVFKSVLAKGGTVRAIAAPGCATFSRKEIDDLTKFAQGVGAKGLVWWKVKDDGSFESTMAKFVPADVQREMAARMQAKPGDLILAVADAWEPALAVCGALRIHFRDRLKLAKAGDWRLLWVVDFPLFEYNAEEKQIVARHHPFTSPNPEDLDKLESDPGSIRARAYDLVLNGNEIGGGSIRIHRREIQQRVFRLLGISDEQAKEKFSFLLEALQYGAPPHGGIALGLDRVVALLTGAESIREVVAYPKTQKGQDLMNGAPSPIDEKQMRDLFIKTVPPPAPAAPAKPAAPPPDKA